MPKSRSTSPENLIGWRHPLMFTSEEVKDQYPDYDPKKPLNQYEGTDRDAYMLFRPQQGFTDFERISNLQRAPEVDWAKFHADYEANPQTAVAQVSTVEKASYARAYLAQMTAQWSGPFFTIPSTFTVEDETGSNDEEEKKTPHPHAGELMPIDTAWVGTIEPLVILAAKEFLDQLYNGGNLDREAMFHPGTSSLDGAGSDRRGNRNPGGKPATARRTKSGTR